MTDLNPKPDKDFAPGDWARPLLDRQVEILGRLAEVGLKVALAIEHQAEEVLAPTPAPDTPAEPRTPPPRSFMTYAHVARAVRQTLMLQGRVIRDINALERGRLLAAERQTRERRERLKQTLEDTIERIAEHNGRDDEMVERLVNEAAERLETDDLYGYVLARPVRDLIAEICEDLGLEPDWDSLGQEGWVIEDGSHGPQDIILRSSRRRPGPRASSSGDSDSPQNGWDDG